MQFFCSGAVGTLRFRLFACMEAFFYAAFLCVCPLLVLNKVTAVCRLEEGGA